MDNIVNNVEEAVFVEDERIIDHYDDDDDSVWLDPSANTERMIQRLTNDESSFYHLELEDGCLSEWFQNDVEGRVGEFLSAIRGNTTVTHVSVSGEFIKEMAALWTEVEANDNEENAVSFDGMLLDAISQLPALKSLVLQEVIDFDGYSLPVDFLNHVLQKATGLEELTLRFVELTQPVTPSEEDDLDASLASLHRDDENSAANRALFGAFRNHPSLRAVTLSQLRLEEGVNLNSLIRGLASIPNLNTVKLHMAIQREQERRHIRVDDDDDDNNHQSRFQEASLKPLGMRESLQVLELSSLTIIDEADLLQVLYRHPSLKCLSLAHAELSFSGWATLAQMLQRAPRRHQEHCVSLEDLQLDHMSGLDDATIQLLSRALGGGTSAGNHHVHAPTLKDLRLLNVIDLGVVGWKAIGDMIATNQSLISLSLENVQGMDDDAVIEVVHGLEQNTSLRRLELQVFAGHCTRFSQKVGQKAFVKLLQSGQNITLVNLYTQARGDLEVQLEFYLNLNRTGLRPYVLEKQLPPDATPLKFWKLLELHRFDLDIIFYVLTTNPPFVISCLRSVLGGHELC